MNGTKEQSTYRYAIVEGALVAVFGVSRKGLQSFQARIRHLRGLGVPDLPRSGSGKHLGYSFQQVLEVAFALSLQRYGIAPRISAEVGPAIAAVAKTIKPTGDPREDVYVLLEPAGSSLSCEYVPGVDLLGQKIDAGLVSDDALLMNVSSLVRKIESALTSKERK